VQEKRRHYRKRASFALEFQIGDGPRQPGICRDFSLGGVSIQTDVTAPFGAKVTIYWRLKGLPQPSTLPGLVRWAKPGSLGVQFGSLGARDTYAISEMLVGDSIVPPGE
jgi:type IV pilus assembly protein PilZ